MTFKRDVLKIMSHPNWIKGSLPTYNGLRLMLIKQLGITDRRSIAKWIGKSKTLWKKRRTPFQTSNVKTTEWQKGLLEEFRIIERRYYTEEELKENPYIKNTIQFKILEDKTYFK